MIEIIQNLFIKNGLVAAFIIVSIAMIIANAAPFCNSALAPNIMYESAKLGTNMTSRYKKAQSNSLI